MSERVEGLVTTIIPVYNRARLLHEAVDSVLGQTWRSIEIVIVDDGSTDETPAAAREIAQAQRAGVIHVIRQENAGTGAARETGRLRARGEFIQYLDSDDILLPHKFESQVRGLREHPECGVSYGMTRWRRADGSAHPMPLKGSGKAVETMFPSFLVERWWNTPTPLYRASVCDAAGPWTNLRLEEDWEYDCRIAALGTRLHYVPDYVAEYRDGAPNRLCIGEAIDAFRLGERARSHELVYGHARRAGIGMDSPEMRHYARELFLLSRQCGAAGLAVQSQRLFELARDASGPRGSALDFRLYRAAAALLGWNRAGWLACRADALRRGGEPEE